MGRELSCGRREGGVGGGGGVRGRDSYNDSGGRIEGTLDGLWAVACCQGFD